jgi:hypothetical protein
MMNMTSGTLLLDDKQHIEFDEIKTNEEIVIETQNSTYKFCLRDVASRRGILSGGAFGTDSRMAIFLGAIAKDGESYTSDYWGLKCEARALFFIETESGLKHMITSVITNLVHVKADASTYIC